MSLLDEYDAAGPLYAAFTRKVESLVSDLMTAGQFNVHTISSRVKGRSSLVDKIEQKSNQYKSLEDVTDLSGIRIVTYFEDEVQRIAHLIEQQFHIDKENSSDKRDILDPDRFGYLSLHYVLGFSEQRLKLMEYQSFRGLKCELQIRSILQHAWAEIEHDLGYKNKVQVPREIRRRFSRVAGLLELVDQEFVGIDRDLKI